MKTTVILMAAVLVSGVAFASGNLRLSMKPAEKERALVEIEDEALREVNIDVMDQSGEVIFSKTLVDAGDNYKRKYDFSGLDDGNYVLRVNSGNELNETRFAIDRGVVAVTGERKEVEPHVAKEGNIWKLSYLNFPQERMYLFVYDGNNLLHQEKIEPVFAVHKGLDFSELLPGTYQVIFTNDFNAYEYNVDVK